MISPNQGLAATKTTTLSQGVKKQILLQVEKNCKYRVVVTGIRANLEHQNMGRTRNG